MAAQQDPPYQAHISHPALCERAPHTFKGPWATALAQSLARPLIQGTLFSSKGLKDMTNRPI